MRLWFEPSGEVPLREQIVAQISLAIASGELAAGARLPSTRELARRYRLHANTVSGAYRQLEREGKVELRRGSGVFVLRDAHLAIEAGPQRGWKPELERELREVSERARERGAPEIELQEHLRAWTRAGTADHLVIVEPDEELRRILVAEVQAAIHLPVVGVGLDAASRDTEELWRRAVALVLPSKAHLLREAHLPPGVEIVVLQVRSVPASLSEWLPLPVTALVGVASSWTEFLRLAKTMLVAAGFEPDGLVCRDAREPGWESGLASTAGVVCDVVTAAKLPHGTRPVVFRVLADLTIQRLDRLLVSPASGHGAR